jgi:hypothetical protein
MIRALSEELILFLIPFALFAAYLLARRRKVLAWASWSDQSLWLVISGLALVIVVLLMTGLTADRQKGGFRPSHMENGRIVPGEFR